MNALELLRSIGWLVPTTVCLLGLAILQYYRNVYSHWPKRGIAGPTPWPLVADLSELLSSDKLDLQLQRLRKYGKVYGTYFFGKPLMQITDAEVVRQICIKDFDNFTDHEAFDYLNIYQKNFLFFLKGQHWRRARALMSPSFTSGKLRKMFKQLVACADDLVDHFHEQTSKPGGDIVNLLQIYSLYTIDGITTCCYGLRLNCERKGKRVSARNNQILEDCLRLTNMSTWRAMVSQAVPRFLLKAVGFKLTPASFVRSLISRMETLIKERRESHSGRHYEDLLQMLVDARLDDKPVLEALDQVENHYAGLTDDSLVEFQRSMQARLNEDTEVSNYARGLSDLEILSAATLLIVVGADTTRISLATISYLLAHNPIVQERLFAELSQIADYNETQVGRHLVFEHEKLTRCEYLDAVISESLRFVTPVAFTDRGVHRDYLIEKYNVKLEAGSRLLIGIHALHNDPDYWREPRKFNPDRFMQGEKEKIVPGSYAPFSLGPRHCIGMRFSLMETKLGLAKVVMNFKLEPAPGTAYPPPATGLGLTRIRDCRVRVLAR